MVPANSQASPAPLKFQDDVIVLEISPDEMTARAAISDFSLPLPELARKLKALMTQAGVRAGIQVENIKTLLQTQRPHHREVIARGEPAREGKPARIKHLIDFSARQALHLDDSHNDDLTKWNHPNLVFEGTPLVEITPGVPGQPGKTVKGRPLPPRPIAKTAPKPGKNTHWHPGNSSLIIADCDGLAYITPENIVEVEPRQIIRGNAEHDLQQLFSDGSLIVMGDVKPGSRIKAKEDVEVFGTAEDAYLEAGRDVLLHRGFVGRGHGSLIAGRDAIIGFAFFKKISAGRNIWFQTELIGCEAQAGQQIISAEGRIVGGTNEALKKINIRTAGSDENVKTELIAGQQQLLQQKIARMEELIQNYYEELDMTKKNIYDLIVKKMNDHLTAEELTALDQHQASKDEIPQKIQEIEQQLTQMNQEIEEIKHAEIEVRGAIHPNVHATVGKLDRTIKDKTFMKKFVISKGKLVLSPLL